MIKAFTSVIFILLSFWGFFYDAHTVWEFVPYVLLCVSGVTVGYSYYKEEEEALFPGKWVKRLYHIPISLAFLCWAVESFYEDSFWVVISYSALSLLHVVFYFLLEVLED